jgi:hypothetical protein
MSTTAYATWFDAVKSLNLVTMSDLFSTTPSVTMFLTTMCLTNYEDLQRLFGNINICRVNALQWCLWNHSGDQNKRQAVISWLIQVILVRSNKGVTTMNQNSVDQRGFLLFRNQRLPNSMTVDGEMAILPCTLLLT